MAVYAMYFSPTGSTKRIVQLLAGEFGDYQQIDLSKRGEDFHQTLAPDDLCIIGVPSYGGRVPAVALERMKALRGTNTAAVLVAAYGNRAYDDTLKELEEQAVSGGFHCVAAIAAVAEHSVMHQFAAGRPDAADQAELAQFAQKIRLHMQDTSPDKKLALPGSAPYREYKGIPLKPRAGKKCTECGQCARLCPVGAIPLDQPKKTDTSRCISCMRCIKVCPQQARSVNSLLVKVAAKKMQAACADRKKNELFLEA